MPAGSVRQAPNVQKYENILSGASLGAGVQSALSLQIPCYGAQAVYFTLSADADPSAAATPQIGHYFDQKPGVRRTTLTQHTAQDTDFPAADISETAVFRVLPATGGGNMYGALVSDRIDIRITNGGAGAMLNFRVDAHVIYN